MTELNELYQEVVMDHSRKPRNFGEMDEADQTVDVYNPFCGDTIRLYLKLDDNVISDASFRGQGCAISRASASMMTESVKGKSREEAVKTLTAFLEMMTRGPGADFDADGLGDMAYLSGVGEFPTRVKCATLAWHALQGALRNKKQTASTEE